MARRELAGRAVAITGAAGGLGRALVQALLARGARVAALDVDAAALATLPSEALALACDITDPRACRGVLAKVHERFGALDVLVNNAGISHRSLLAQTDAAVIRRVMEVNFFGALHMTQAALPILAARRGAIVVVSSVAGFAPLAARAGYSASKHALHGLFDTLRAELEGSGVHVLIACPAFIRTGIGAAHLGADGRAARGPRTEVGEALEPADAAERIVRALEDGRERLLLGRVARLSWWISRLAPGLYARLMARRMRAELGR
ncbi:MAG: SDR family oxidoreductase [Burkholderiales bacterium]|nr:SDR family oxidoreductase [Burkholderiales bacterium]